MVKKRRPGRPKGTCIDDTRYFLRLADLMVAETGLKKTTALKRIEPTISKSIEARIIRKWNKVAERYLGSARQRVENSRKSPYMPPLTLLELLRSQPLNTITAAAEARRQLSALDDTAGGIRNLIDQAATVRALYNSPEMRLMREMQNSPVWRASHGLI